MQSGHWGAWPEVTQEFRGRQQLGPALFTASWVLFNISKEETEVIKSSETSSSFFFFISFVPIFFKIAERLWPCQGSSFYHQGWANVLSCTLFSILLLMRRASGSLAPLFSSFPGHERASHSLAPPPAARTRA